MKNSKSTPMSLLVGGLTVAFIMFALFTWFSDLHEGYIAMMLAAIGFSLAYLSIKVLKLEQYINRGLLWAGIACVLISTFFGWNLFTKDLRPLLIGGLLVLAIVFGTKYKRYLI